MSFESENNRRIVKNTGYLYIRMFITMLVGLYTSRVVLNTLGVSDYGVYNVVGGVIGMLSYVSGLISGGISRFLTIDLGKGDIKNLRQTFSITNTLSFCAAAIILLLGETVGLWFLNAKLNIEQVRMGAANWVYQCTLASFLLSVIQTPYTASIIAHEKMDVYACMSLFDVSMKLLTVFLLRCFDFDKLKLYALLMFSVSLLNFVIYRIVCSHKFEECRFSFAFEKSKFKEMMDYSGWNVLGALSGVLNNSGLNILLNLFFGTTVNAARGIALQVSGIVQQFRSNFQMASNPQIMKYYAQGNISGMSKLICNSSKYSAFLLTCLIVPISLNIDDFLIIWLGQKPEYTSWFCRVMLLLSLFEAVDYPIGTGIQAVGKMKLPTLTCGFLYLSVFPITYVSFKLGVGPVAGYCIYLLVTPLIVVADLLLLRHYTGFSIKGFLKEVAIPMIVVGVISSCLSYCIVYLVKGDGFLLFFVRCLATLAITVIITYCLGLPKNLKKKALSIIKSKLAISV